MMLRGNKFSRSGDTDITRDVFFTLFCFRYLLLHQAFLDMMTCLMSTIIHLQPTYWRVSNYYWEIINCYLWYVRFNCSLYLIAFYLSVFLYSGVNSYFRHSQYFFWYFLYTSANNLVYLAYDRYRAVVHPLHYKDISK